MTTFSALTGSFLTFIGFLCVHHPTANLTSLFFQGLIIVAPFMLLSSCLLLALFRSVPVLSARTLGKPNRYVSVALTAVLFIIPIEKRLLLNDALFIVFAGIINWTWISWSYFLEIKK